MRFAPLSIFVAAAAVLLLPNVSSQSTGVTHCRNGHVALTFDDGATQFTRQTIDQLVNAGHHATFCINVNNYGELQFSPTIWKGWLNR